MLDLKKLLTMMLEALSVDYPIEQTISASGWSYTKWKSGKLECWYDNNPGAYTCGTSRGSMYSGAWLSRSFPVAFKANAYPTVTATVALTTDAYNVLAQVSEITTSGCKVRIVSSGSIASNSNYRLKIHAVGRWN